MLSSTVELITLWASSSSPSLLAFCFSNLIIIAVLLLGGRGDCTPGAAGAETLDGIRVQGGNRSSRRRESPAAAASVVVHRRCAHDDADGRPKVCVAEVGTDDIRAPASDQSSAAEDGTAVDDKVQEECGGDDEEEDELRMRAEEFIRRMNRIWMAENVGFC